MRLGALRHSHALTVVGCPNVILIEIDRMRLGALRQIVSRQESNLPSHIEIDRMRLGALRLITGLRNIRYNFKD